MLETGLTHKSYIDGLRAIAVLAVILFHLHPAVLSGGYLGVDIFFVISGFVISQSLYKDYSQNGKINILSFYKKRFKRLYPALVVMVVCTTILYILFGFLWDSNLFIKSGIFSVLAVSNLYFLKQGDNYFAQDLINPLLHTWSLGVEEQFYFVYPVLLALAFWYMRKQKMTLYVLGVVILLTSLCSYVLFSLNLNETLSNFYFPLARFWELGAGCALFFLLVNAKRIPSSRFLGHISLVVICCVLLFQTFIGNLFIETLCAVLGTAGIIYAGIANKSAPLIQFLENRFLVFIGKISYSLYLWHLPVIYFSHLYLTDTLFYVSAITITFITALLSYYFVEKPLRYSDLLDKIFPVMLKGGGVVVCVVLLLIIGVGVSDSSRFINTQLNSLQETFSRINHIERNSNLGERINPNYTINENNVELHCGEGVSGPGSIKLQENCFKQSENKDSVVFLTGDSHAMHFLPMIDQSKVLSDIYYRDFPRSLIVNAEVEFQSEAVFQERMEELRRLEEMYDEVYFATSLFLNQQDYDLSLISTNLHAYVQAIKMDSPDTNIVFIAPTPVFEAGPQSCVILERYCLLEKSGDMAKMVEVLDIYDSLREEYSNVHVFNPYDIICPDSYCKIYDKEKDFLLYRDDDHLSVEGSGSLTSYFDNWFAKSFKNSSTTIVH